MFISCDTVKQQQKWSGYTLVLPAVSVGNVGQLATDLLISTLSMKRVGYLHDDSFLPLVGNNPFCLDNMTGSNELVTAVEVYENAVHQVIAVQQRTPFVKGKRKQFLDKLQVWIRESRFREVIILSSSHAHERIDKQLQGTQLRYLVSFLEPSIGSMLKDALKWVELEKRSPAPGIDDAKTEDSCIFIPGGGIAKGLFENCDGAGIPVAVLLIFCAEGDNCGDALQLASYLNSWKKWITSQEVASGKIHGEVVDGWRIPPSWKLQFGSKVDQMIFL